MGACWLQVFYNKERTRVLSDLMRQCFGDEPRSFVIIFGNWWGYWP
jgi:hypothetical protein